jgi:hypothetical protein
MTWELSQDEKSGVLGAPDTKQYSYFLNKVADWGEVWSLSNGERFASLTDPDDDTKLFPVWPHAGYARDVATGAWEDFEPKAIDVHDFLEYCQTFERDGQKVALMHQPSGDYFHMPPIPLATDIQAALDEVE